MFYKIILGLSVSSLLLINSVGNCFAQVAPIDRKIVTSTDQPVIDAKKLQTITAIENKLIQNKTQQNIDLPKWLSEYWVQFLALVVSLLGVALAVTGFTFSSAKKKKSVTRFLHQIDDTYSSYKWKTKRCEAELYRLQDLVEDQLKAGKIEEGPYHLLTMRIEKYLKEIRENEGMHVKRDKAE